MWAIATSARNIGTLCMEVTTNVQPRSTKERDVDHQIGIPQMRQCRYGANDDVIGSCHVIYLSSLIVCNPFNGQISESTAAAYPIESPQLSKKRTNMYVCKPILIKPPQCRRPRPGVIVAMELYLSPQDGSTVCLVGHAAPPSSEKRETPYIFLDQKDKRQSVRLSVRLCAITFVYFFLIWLGHVTKRRPVSSRGGIELATLQSIEIVFPKSMITVRKTGLIQNRRSFPAMSSIQGLHVGPSTDDRRCLLASSGCKYSEANVDRSELPKLSTSDGTCIFPTALDSSASVRKGILLGSNGMSSYSGISDF
ncbi:hypothetical protein J6590_057791 [Homalodisca vitripennis]|nr:hypothetical protein J6590_057791 [Homalodisca vitripennis]